MTLARFVRSIGILVASLTFTLGTHGWAAPIDSTVPPERLLVDDEPVVRTTHTILTRGGTLTYQAIVGRMPIRTGDTGQVHARLSFVAFVVTGRGARRPLTFAWNGGPLVASAIVNMDGLGPRRRTRANVMVDNPDTLLATTDLVFMDPVRTGFSRPERPEFLPEFMNMLGDVATTVEFIRAFRARFHAFDQPLFIIGESYGVFRAAAVADTMTATGGGLAGAVLISGDIPNFAQAPAFYNAMHVPARAATALYYRRLTADDGRPDEAVIAEAAAWANDVYRPALLRIAALSPAERTAIVERLSHYTGVAAAEIDQRTLVVTGKQYLEKFFGAHDPRQLTYEDTRVLAGSADDNLGNAGSINAYIRGELGYRTDLIYAGLEKGYVPTPGPPPPTFRDLWHYNQPGATPEIVAAMRDDGEAWPIARVNPNWIGNALRQDPRFRVLVATGRYDPLNMCEGNAAVVATLTADLADRIATKCYPSGHIIFRDDVARPVFLSDVAAFIRAQTVRHADMPLAGRAGK